MFFGSLIVANNASSLFVFLHLSSCGDAPRCFLAPVAVVRLTLLLSLRSALRPPGAPKPDCRSISIVEGEELYLYNPELPPRESIAEAARQFSKQ